MVVTNVKSCVLLRSLMFDAFINRTSYPFFLVRVCSGSSLLLVCESVTSRVGILKSLPGGVQDVIEPPVFPGHTTTETKTQQ